MNAGRVVGSVLGVRLAARPRKLVAPDSVRMLGHELKIQRAAAHLAALTAVVNDWLATDAHTIIREFDPDSGDTLCRAKVTGTPPDELSLHRR